MQSHSNFCVSTKDAAVVRKDEGRLRSSWVPIYGHRSHTLQVLYKVRVEVHRGELSGAGSEVPVHHSIVPELIVEHHRVLMEHFVTGTVCSRPLGALT
jgi:hypothetical protein